MPPTNPDPEYERLFVIIEPHGKDDPKGRTDEALALLEVASAILRGEDRGIIRHRETESVKARFHFESTQWAQSYGSGR